MTQYVTDESLDTVVGTLERAGATRRLEVRLPSDAATEFPSGEVVRLVLDESEYRTRLDRTADGTPVVRGAYDTPSQARDPGASENRLDAWVEAENLDAGRSVHVDVVVPEFKYGVRAPGASATYRATKQPDSGLADIAKSIEDQ